MKNDMSKIRHIKKYIIQHTKSTANPTFGYFAVLLDPFGAIMGANAGRNWSFCQFVILSFTVFGSRHSRPGIDSYRSAFRKNLASINVGAQGAELADEIIVATVNEVGIGDLGNAVGQKTRNHHSRATA